MKRFVIAGVLVLATVTTACSARDATTLPAVKSAAAQRVPVAFVVKVPHAGTTITVRGRKYISPATQAIQIDKQTFNISPSAPNCTMQTSDLACTFSVDAPQLGLVVFTVTTYDRPLANDGSVQGNKLSTGQVDATINAGQANQVKVTLNGVPSKVTITIANLTPPIGQAETTPVNFDVRDADGYAIVGPYANPVYLYFQGGYWYGLHLYHNGTDGWNSAQISNSSDVISLKYTGGMVTTTTIVGNVAGTIVYSANFTPVPTFGPETPLAASLVGSDVAMTGSRAGAELWFTEPAKHMLAHVALPSSTIDETTLPSGGTPFMLTAEMYPDDAVDVSETGSSNYARVTYYGSQASIWEVPLPAGASAYQVAVSGPFAAPSTVVATNPAGKLEFWQWDYTLLKMVPSELPTGVPNSSPANIVMGPGGWDFTDTTAGAVGVIGYNKSIKYYPLPTAGAAPTRIAVSGANWMAAVIEPAVSKVAFFNDPQHIQDYACSGVPVNVALGQKFALVLTADGNIDVFDPLTGARTTYTPPASSAGPIVAIVSRGDGDLLVFHSNGTTSTMQDFFYD